MNAAKHAIWRADPNWSGIAPLFAAQSKGKGQSNVNVPKPNTDSRYEGDIIDKVGPSRIPLWIAFRLEEVRGGSNQCNRRHIGPA